MEGEYLLVGNRLIFMVVDLYLVGHSFRFKINSGHYFRIYIFIDQHSSDDFCPPNAPSYRDAWRRAGVERICASKAFGKIRSLSCQLDTCPALDIVACPIIGISRMARPNTTIEFLSTICCTYRPVDIDIYLVFSKDEGKCLAGHYTP